MTATHEHPSRSPEQSASPAPHSVQAFEACLAKAIAACADGRPHVLIEIDVARGADIRAAAGTKALEALRERLLKHVREQLGARVPVCAHGPLGMLALLDDTSCTKALELARRLRSRIDHDTFHWHGHPFRLGAYVGVMELGPHPSDPDAWLASVREVSRCARELGGEGLHVVRYNDHAWTDMEHDRDWHEHITRIIA